MINGPVVIGGVGGSGTRVVAQILQELNFYMGNDLNEALDNLSYTLLFKRKNWFIKNRNNTEVINKKLGVLKTVMTNPSALTISDYLCLIQAAFSMSRNGHNEEKDGSGTWAFERLKIMFNSNQGLDNNRIGWGWKEPNSHLLLENMNDFFPDFKYIHTIRNGLDMAFSENQQQLFNWGSLFGIQLPENQDEIPEASFRYWLEANRKVMEVGALVGAERFMVLNFDKLCANVSEEMSRLLSFLEIKLDDDVMEKILALPKVPSTSERFRKEDLSWLDEEGNDFLLTHGFKTVNLS